MGQPQTPKPCSPGALSSPKNNALQQNNGTQNIKQPGRPLHYSHDIISDEESMGNEDKTQNGKQHPWQTITKKQKLTKTTKRIQDNTAQIMTINKFQVLANINNETPNKKTTQQTTQIIINQKTQNHPQYSSME
jgi:hypothetical protein